jgi:hypothetical protein
LGVFARKLERMGLDRVGGSQEEQLNAIMDGAALKQMIEEDQKCWVRKCPILKGFVSNKP